MAAAMSSEQEAYLDTLSHLRGMALRPTADFHVHLRDGPMMHLVVPTIRKGGVDTVFVMIQPNLVPPITTVQRALEYKHQLQSIEPNVNYLMSLYLHHDITPEVIREAKEAGIAGVKSYPAGVTTNSAAGVVDYEAFFPVFAEMERQDIVLNIHGEHPSGGDVTVITAEETFLPTLLLLNKKFPNLRIVLEHCTTAAALDAVRACGPTVVGTITAHHLSLVVDDWAGDPFCFCKPVAKFPRDRTALLQAVVSGETKFFFGSDSAPHPATAKRGGDKIAAGVFTQPYATQYVLDALSRAIIQGVISKESVTKDRLEGFLSRHGRAFYRVSPISDEELLLDGALAEVEKTLKARDGRLEVVPFRRGESIWKLTWASSL